jgi:hypothetical protein
MSWGKGQLQDIKDLPPRVSSKGVGDRLSKEGAMRVGVEARYVLRPCH